MRILRFTIFLVLFAIPAAVSAFSGNDIPAATKWYFHADFKEMRSNAAGKHLLAWLEDEIFDDIRDETGVDLEREADYLTAFAADDGGMVIVIDGKIGRETEDKVVAMAASSGTLDRLGSFYHIKDSDGDDADVHVDDGDNIDIEIGSFEQGAYFSFAIKNKLIITSTRETMEALLESKGRVAGERATNGQLFVLTAERNLMQAGARTDDFNGSWDSNILRSTKQAALLVAEKAGKIAIEVELVTTEAEIANSLASIVRGLISLQVFDEDMDPDMASLLRNTNVDVKDKRLSINVALAPESVIAAIE